MATIDLGKIKQVWRGTYNNGTAYVVDDLVAFTDSNITSTYICVANSTGNNPSSSGTAHASWNYVAKGVVDPIPSQSGNSGKVLKTDGSAVSWGTDAGGKLVKQAHYNVTSASVSQDVAQGATSSTDFLQYAFTATSSSNIVLWSGVISVGCNVAETRIFLYKNGSPIFQADADGSRQRASFSGRNQVTSAVVSIPWQFVITNPSTSGTNNYQIRCAHNDNATQTILLNRSSNNLDADYMARACSHMTFLEYTT